MASAGAQVEEEEERRRLERSILEACTRSLEGADLLVSAFVQALHSYRRSSVCTPFPTALFRTVDDFKDKDFTAAAVAVQSFPPLRHIVSTWPRDTLLSSSGSERACTGEGPVPDHGTGDASADEQHLALNALCQLIVVIESSSLEILQSSIWRRTMSSTGFKGVLTATRGTFYSGNRAGSKRDGHEGLTNDDSEGSSCLSCTSSSAQKMSIRALKLLHWILRFRHHVEFVQDPVRELLGLLRLIRRDAPLGLPHYVLKIQDMEEINNVNRLSVFHTVKAQYGSIFAFHGTPAENLHSILRCGLLNMSRTQLQQNGAIFGEGVYLSTDPAVAHGFCKAEDGWEYSSLGPRVRYLLVCEVAKGEGVSLVDENVTFSSDPRSSPMGTSGSHSRLEKPAAANGMPQTYIVVQNSDLVKIRFVFVYNEPSQRRSVGLFLGQQSMVPEVLRRPGSSPAGSTTHKLGLPPVFQRLDWCKTFIVLYIALLVGVGLMKSNALKFGRGSSALHFWPFYQ